MKLETIRRPKNAFVTFFRQFLRDELMMFFGSAIATALVFKLLATVYGEQIPGWILASVLSLAGPLLEKPWMLSHYVWSGFKRWRSANTEHDGQTLVQHIKVVLREDQFLRTLRADILYHDTFYMFFLFLISMAVQPSDPAVAGCIAAASFLLAVAGASYFEVKYVELRRERLLHCLADLANTQPQRYGEFRLAVPGGLEPDSILERVRDEFELGPTRVREVQDFSLIGAQLPEFNEWEGYMQVRLSDGKARLHVVFTQTQYAPHVALRTLYIHKEKVVLPLKEASISAIRSALGPYAESLVAQDAQLRSIFHFTRSYAPGPVYSFVVDNVMLDDNQAFALLEVKLKLEGKNILHHAKQLLQLSVPTVEVTYARAFTPEILRDLPTPIEIRRNTVVPQRNMQ